jgi:hypothetical protein
MNKAINREMGRVACFFPALPLSLPEASTKRHHSLTAAQGQSSHPPQSELTTRAHGSVSAHETCLLGQPKVMDRFQVPLTQTLVSISWSLIWLLFLVF